MKNNETEYGYKWFADKEHDVYIICLEVTRRRKLSLETFDSERCASDCIVKSITRFRDGKQFGSVSGRAYFDFNYSVGKRIKGEWIFYCSTLEKLFDREYYAIKQSLVRYASNINNPLSHIKIVGNKARIRKQTPLLDGNSSSPYAKYFSMVNDPLQMQVYTDMISKNR